MKLLLPTDTLAATEFAPDAESRVVPTGAIPADMEGMDIGPDTTAAFCEAVKGAGTVVWNGPMGIFEFAQLSIELSCIRLKTYIGWVRWIRPGMNTLKG